MNNSTNSAPRRKRRAKPAPAAPAPTRYELAMLAIEAALRAICAAYLRELDRAIGERRGSPTLLARAKEFARAASSNERTFFQLCERLAAIEPDPLQIARTIIWRAACAALPRLRRLRSIRHVALAHPVDAQNRARKLILEAA